jgi:hypothetical protein
MRNKIVLIIIFMILLMGFAYAAVPAYKSWLSDGVSLFTFENVGIGTDDPKALLDVHGEIAVNGSAIVNSSGNWIGDSIGLAGPEGPAGRGGQNGTDGLDCWDVNENQECDPVEDRNTDAFCNVLDCRGDKGEQGEAGLPTSSFAVCLDGAGGGPCSCSGTTLVSVQGPCFVTSDTGSCTGTRDGTNKRCCVCSV